MIGIKIAAALMFAGVALGAFGAHALKARLSPASLAIYQTAVFYHMVHALAILCVAALAPRLAIGKSAQVTWIFTLGILLFSGSLYLLAVTGIKGFGAITPIGGLLFLIGWLYLFFA